MDLFEELENSQTSSGDVEAPGEKTYSWIKDLAENLEGSLNLRYHHFFKTKDNSNNNDDRNDVGEALFRFSTWTGRDRLKVHTSGWIETGTQADTYKGVLHWLQDKEHDRRHVELNELYALYSLENADITLGKKEFTTGICTLFSPSDRFRPMDLNDPMDPKQFGIWQVKAEYYQGDTKFECALMPVNVRNKPPAVGSGWWGQASNGQTMEMIAKDSPDISWQNMDYFARAKTTKNGWDFFGGIHSGPNPYSVLKNEADAQVEKIIRVYTLSSGFSTTAGKFEIHGEALFNMSEGNKDDDYLSCSIGLNYTLDDHAAILPMDNIVFTLEYACEIITHRQSADHYIRSSKDGRLGTNDLLARIKFKYDECLKFENLFHYQLSHNAWMNRFEVSHRLMEGWTLAGAVELFEGKEEAADSPYTFDAVNYAYWDRNDRLVVRLKFEF